MLTRLIIAIIAIGLIVLIRRQLSTTDTRRKTSSPPGKYMSREEAMALLGLTDPYSKAQVLSAYKRLINKVHPDKGGTELLASQLNTAKKTLLKDF